METEFDNTENEALNKTDVMQRCFKCFEQIMGAGIDWNSSPEEEGMDGLDFIEIVMEAELEFDCVIEDKDLGDYKNFKSFIEFAEWLVSFNVA